VAIYAHAVEPSVEDIDGAAAFLCSANADHTRRQTLRVDGEHKVD
jgi:hypothetical protein